MKKVLIIALMLVTSVAGAWEHGGHGGWGGRGGWGGHPGWGGIGLGFLGGAIAGAVINNGYNGYNGYNYGYQQPQVIIQQPPVQYMQQPRVCILPNGQQVYC